MALEFTHVVETAGEAAELTGIAVILAGITLALARYGLRWLRRERERTVYQEARESIGRSILLGLELLVAGDIIRTVAVSPTFTSVGVLAAVVLIRTFLSFTLELEISGRWPWQHRRAE